MKIISVFKRSMREQLRSPWVFLLSILMAPIMVLTYYIFFGGTSTVYTVLVLNQDLGADDDGVNINHGLMVCDQLRELRYPDGQSMLNVRLVESEAEAVELLQQKSAHTFFIIPRDFSENLQASRYENVVSFRGDMVNPMYLVATVLSSTKIDEYVNHLFEAPSIIDWREEPLGSSRVQTEFDQYVPALSVLSVIVVIFQSAMAVTSEVEQGTIKRLKLTKVSSLDLLGGITLTQILVSVLSVSLTFVTAFILGFNSIGPLWVAAIIGIVTSFSVMGVGLIIASVSRKVSDSFIYANFPFILMMFFSGAAFPIPRYKAFTFMGHSVHLFDWLPPTHAVLALNKVLVLGCGLDQIVSEVAALFLLSVIYFVAGVALFNRAHLYPK